MEKIDVVKHILRYTNHGSFVNAGGGYAWAPSNVALCKYWGKRDVELNLPITSSLSISLGKNGTFTHITQNTEKDQYILNGNPIPTNTKFAQRLKKFLNLFRPRGAAYNIDINSNIPTAAGLASSACGFASLVQALNNLYDWKLQKSELSILARLGSGSACRSLWDGFVEWQAGESDNGMDSHGILLPDTWPELRIGVILISSEPKAISSTEAMQLTLATSPQYKNWPHQATQDLENIKLAIAQKDFELLGETAENNAVAMHTMMLQATPPIVYSLISTTVAMQKVWELRDNGVPVFFTQDAGPNLQILFTSDATEIILGTFPNIEIIAPFGDNPTSSLILVDDNDCEVGTDEKLLVHQQGKLHRAFSIFILRTNHDKIEILLQKRSSTKYHSANLWTNTCCGHPKPGENIIEAATKRLQEEMGFTTELETIGSFQYMATLADVALIENEVDHVLIGYINDAIVSPNSHEVQAYKWVDLAELQVDLHNNPAKYTQWLKPALDTLLQKTTHL